MEIFQVPIETTSKRQCVRTEIVSLSAWFEHSKACRHEEDHATPDRGRDRPATLGVTPDPVPVLILQEVAAELDVMAVPDHPVVVVTGTKLYASIAVSCLISKVFDPDFSRSPMSNRRRHVGSRDNPESSNCIGIFGLSLYTTERELEKEFSKFGPLERVTVVLDGKVKRLPYSSFSER